MKELREASGFGWNDVEKKVTATDDVWKDYIAVSGFQLYAVGFTEYLCE